MEIVWLGTVPLTTGLVSQVLGLRYTTTLFGLRAHLEGQPKAVREIAWKAQIRLCARYRRLTATGKKLPVVVAAIARESAARSHRRRPREPKTRLHTGAEPRRGTPVASYVAEPSPDARPLDREKPRDENTEGGTQPADKSLIDRRLSSASDPMQPQPIQKLLARQRAERLLAGNIRARR